MKHLIKTFLMSGALLIISLSQAAHSVVFGLKGTYNTIPEELKPYSPLHGVVLFETGELYNLYKNKDNAPFYDLVHTMFHEIVEGDLRCTSLPSNPVSAFTPSLIHNLITYGELNNYNNLMPYSIILPGADKPSNLDGIGLTWWQTYKEWCKTKGDVSSRTSDFKRHTKNFLTNLQKSIEIDKDLTLKILSAFVYLKCQTAEELQNYFRLFYPELPFSMFTQTDLTDFRFEFSTKNISSHAVDYVEQMVVSLTTPSIDYSFLITPLPERRFQFSDSSLPTAKANWYPLCVEDTLQTIINCILYDPAQEILNFSNLSPMASPLPALKEFIEKYPDPRVKDYYTITLPDWIKLLSTTPDVNTTVDIKWSEQNFLKILSYLFGIRLQTEQDIALLSSEKRTTLCQKSNDDYYITIQNRIGIFKIILKIRTKETHADATLINNNSFNLQYLNNAISVSNILKEDFSTLIDWSNFFKGLTINNNDDNDHLFSKKEFLDICKEYNVSLEKLMAPSRTSHEYLLDVFIKYNRTDLIEGLIELGIDINKYPDLPTLTPLGKAFLCESTNEHTLKFLIKHGAQLTQEELYGHPLGPVNIIEKIVSSSDYIINSYVRLIFSQEALDINKPFNELGETLFTSIVKKACENYGKHASKYEYLIEELLKKKNGNPNTLFKVQSPNNQTFLEENPLTLSVKERCRSLVRIFLEFGADSSAAQSLVEDDSYISNAPAGKGFSSPQQDAKRIKELLQKK